jgi:hypothetical protein
MRKVFPVMPSFGEIEFLWFDDGSFTDIYFFRTSVADWKRFVAFVNKYSTRCRFDGDNPIPPIADILLDDQAYSHSLEFFVGTVSLKCFFFVKNEIELTIDPREVKGQIEHEIVLKFLAKLSYELHKLLFITPENMPESPFLIYVPLSDTWLG